MPISQRSTGVLPTLNCRAYIHELAHIRSCLASPLLILLTGIFAPMPASDLLISGPVHGATLTIRASARTAGAVDSLTWQGREFINSYDHGRELQSAGSFDGYGECLNPTEAGSEKDGTGAAATSRLVTSKVSAQSLETTVEMAFWLAPGALYPRGCGSHADFRQAKNESARSRDLLVKRVEIGVPGVPDAISYDVTFETAEDHETAVFEALTAYLTPEFSDFFTWNPASGLLAALSDGPGEQPLPVIFSTPDRNFAIGVYVPDLPRAARSAAGYGRWRFNGNPQIAGWNTVKWNAVFREKPAPRGRYRYRCYVAVGALEDVQRTFGQLSRLR